MTAPGQPVERREYVVEPGTPGRLAAALVGYRVPRSLSTWLGVAAVVGLIASIVAGQALPGFVFGVVVLATLFTVVTQYRGTSRLLAAGAYRPGTAMSAEWYADRLVLTTPQTSVTHEYADVKSIRGGSSGGPGGGSGVALLVLRGGRQVLVLPEALVGDDARARLSAAAKD